MSILFVVKDIDSEHLSVMLFSSLLKQHGYAFDVCEARFDKVARKLDQGGVSVVAYSVPTLYFSAYAALNRQLKKRYDFLSVFGGAHPTFAPEIIEEEGVDCICRGEGELALLELAERLSQKRPIRGIQNLWVKEENEIFRNPLRPLLSDLDELPFPDRYLFPRNETFYKGKMHVITSRGCSYECSYCCHPAYVRLYGCEARRIRRRSVDNVVEEILRVKDKAALRLVMFEDDLFVSSPEWIENFCRLYKRKIHIPFFCYVRAESVTRPLVKQLKNAGCVTMSMGLETAHDYLRNVVLGRAMPCATMREATRIIKEENIKLETMNIVAIPGGSLQADFETLKLNIQCRADYSSVKLLMPYPGTRIREVVQDKGLLLEGHPFSSWVSPLRYATGKEKQAVENLHKLFSVVAGFPILLPFLNVLIYLPFGRFYKWVHLLWEGYASFFRLYPTGLKGFWRGVNKYFRLIRTNL